MSLLTKGITRLSQLDIDIDKDWQVKQITNLRAIATTMSHGDVAFRGADVIEKLTADAGKGYNFLRSRGPGLSPVWQDIESLIQYMTAALNRAVAMDLVIPSPGISVAIATAPGGAVSSLRSLSVPEPTVSATALQTSSPPGRLATESLSVPSASISLETNLGNPLGGAVADDGGIQTDETVAANSWTANDMTLLPVAPAVNDAYYFGLNAFWDWLRLLIGQAGAGVWSLAWEYWNGAWATLSVDDGTNGFRNSGWNVVSFTRPGDWIATTVAGIANIYWIRARITAFTSISTQPLGTKALCYQE